MSAVDCLGEYICHAYHSSRSTGLDSALCHSVREIEVFNGSRHHRLIQFYHAYTTEASVGHGTIDLLGTIVLAAVSRSHDGSSTFSKVIQHQYNFVLDITDKLSDLDICVVTTLLDNECKIEFGLLRKLHRLFDCTSVGSNNDLNVQSQNCPHQRRLEVQVVHRQIGKALNLLGMKVHRDDTIDARGSNQVHD